MSVFDEHLEQFEGAQRSALAATVATARTALPGAVEVLAWGMPTFRASDAEGPNILSVTGFKNHNSLFPHSGSLAESLGEALDGWDVTKGTIHFERDRPFPAPLLKRILKARIVEINASYPKRNGELREYYDNGFAKARGRMKGEELTGAWQWWRRDGSLMRSGAFKTGEQVGEWITYDRQGQPHRVTHFGRA